MVSPPSGDVNVINIAGRMARERERCIGMTDEERAWRSKFLKSQILAPHEPVTPPGYYKELYNPLRRFYRFPLDMVQKAITPLVGDAPAYVIRSVTGKLIMGIIGLYSGWYYYKYNTATWMRKSGWKVLRTHETSFPGDKDFPKLKMKKPNEFATGGFEKSPI